METSECEWKGPRRAHDSTKREAGRGQRGEGGPGGCVPKARRPIRGSTARETPGRSDLPALAGSDLEGHRDLQPTLSQSTCQRIRALTHPRCAPRARWDFAMRRMPRVAARVAGPGTGNAGKNRPLALRTEDNHGPAPRPPARRHRHRAARVGAARRRQHEPDQDRSPPAPAPGAAGAAQPAAASRRRRMHDPLPRRRRRGRDRRPGCAASARASSSSCRRAIRIRSARASIRRC